jgi:hypothetical protein
MTKKSLKKPEAVYRRTDNTMSKGKGAKGQTTIYKINTMKQIFGAGSPLGMQRNNSKLWLTADMIMYLSGSASLYVDLCFYQVAICTSNSATLSVGLEPNNLPHPRRECQSLHRSGHKLGFEPTIYHSLCCQPLHHRSGHNKSLKKPEAVYRRTDNTMSKGKGMTTSVV